MQVNAHRKKEIWKVIAKMIRTLEVHSRQSAHCRKRWDDLRCWAWKITEAQLGLSSQCGRDARRTMTTLMAGILPSA
ncbi:hypothetical protein NDU88_010091 [Pleurodeles waltl]|uniref:Myb-like domain-containing protein n=1 Tax=Pleurodeles waltl TaxID=8319 RepID=A0AAV7S292_PLEWA|nr:hypothetical protein NDU88_010091 [Pleurodeles waltl]